MNILTQQAKQRQGAVNWALKHGNASAVRKYGVSESSVKRWKKRYDGTWQSLRERSHRPHHSPTRHTADEEELIHKAFKKYHARYGWEGVYMSAKRRGYTRSLSGMIYAAKRMGLGTQTKKKRPPRKHFRRYPELEIPGEKVQIDVKEVPYCCLTGDALTNERRFYQWTAIDEATRFRFVYAFEEHTPENSKKFLKKLQKQFPFPIKTVQTDNGTEFTYRFISEETPCPFETALKAAQINHKLIPPRTPWHNGKVERSHRNDQRYFYDWETFSSVDELNQKLKKHLRWSNSKPMRTLEHKTPKQILSEKLKNIA